MAFRTIPLPWLSGGLIVLGYAAFSWLQAKRVDRQRSAASALPPAPVEPLSSPLQRVPEALALSLDSEQVPASNDAVPRAAALGASFLGRASEALSPFSGGPRLPLVPR